MASSAAPRSAAAWAGEVGRVGVSGPTCAGSVGAARAVGSGEAAEGVATVGSVGRRSGSEALHEASAAAATRPTRGR